MIELRQSTAGQEIPLGYFLDTTDGDTEETGLTIANTDIKLWKFGATTLANKNSGGAAHISNGVYYCTLDATDTNTLGALIIFIHVSGALAVKVECAVLPANVWDSKYSTDKLEVDVTQIGGDTQSAADLKDFADAGYDPALNKVQGVVLTDTCTTNTDMVTEPPTAAAVADAVWDEAKAGHVGAGSFGEEVQSHALESICTEARLAELDAANLPTHVDSLETRLTAARAGYLDNLNIGETVPTQAQINSQVDTALADYDSPTKTEMDTAFTEIKGATWSSATDTLEHIRDKETDIETDTAEIGAAGAGLTAVPWNSSWDTEVQSEVQDAIEVNKLDHLVAVADADDAVDNSIIAKLADSGATADWSNYVNTTDSLRSIRDRGDAAWITGGGGSLTEILNIQPLIPQTVDLADTAVVRIGLGLTNMLDDLPSTAEISPGTIAIDRKAAGGTSWTNIVNDAACSEAAGLVYYDEVFDSGTGYAEGDSIRITFKSQKITVAANDFEITGTDGWIFHTYIRQDAALVKRILGLTHENFRIKNQVYNTNNKLTSATIRIYGSAADCANDTNQTAEYTITAAYDSDSNCNSYTSVKA